MEGETKKSSKKGGMKKNKIANLILIAGIFFAVGFFVSQGNLLNKERQNYITAQEAEEKAEKFILDNLVQPGTEIEIKSVVEEGGLFKIMIDLQGQEIESYLSKDGKDFFPQVMDIEEIEAQNEAAQTGEAIDQYLPKQAKPVVETFVMSYCPYGTQIQKGLLPVVALLKDKIDFDFKFVNYIMHEKQEIDENLLQYCMNEIDQAKYHEYLGCFLTSEDSKSCLNSTGINQSEISRCVATADAKYSITANYQDKSTWNGQYPPFDVHKEENEKYGVQGSPTLVINGQVATSARSPQSLLATICSSFEEAPAECNQELSPETPVPGFGEGTASAASAADCEQ